jgi:hypothetical protein
MKTCTTCGNDIPVRARTCQFCERPQPQAAAPARRPRGAGGPGRSGADEVTTINLKHGMPTAAEAVARLDLLLQTCRATGTPVVRLVHGWGASGRGGAIAVAVRGHLRALQGRGLIRGFVAGEDYSEFSHDGRPLRERHAVLRQTLASDRLNRGITLVEL